MLPMPEVLARLRAEAEPRQALQRAAREMPPPAPIGPSVSPQDDPTDSGTLMTPMPAVQLRLKAGALPRQPAPAPPESPQTPHATRIETVEQYARVVMAIASTRDPAGLLRQYGLTNESWSVTARAWAERVRTDRALGAAYEEAIARLRPRT